MDRLRPLYERSKSNDPTPDIVPAIARKHQKLLGNLHTASRMSRCCCLPGADQLIRYRISRATAPGHEQHDAEMPFVAKHDGR